MGGQEEEPGKDRKMQLGIRLHDIKKAPLEERLAIAHEQGFACGHLALAKVISEYPVDDGALAWHRGTILSLIGRTASW